jgi:small conductance mechanosensitive channel
MVDNGQIKTRPLQQWSVARAFNARLKRKMDEAGIEIPVPQMRLFTSSKDSEGQPWRDDSTPDETGREEHGHESGHARPHTEKTLPMRGTHPAVAVARDVSHEPRPAPPATAQTAPIPPQVPTAGEGKS